MYAIINSETGDYAYVDNFKLPEWRSVEFDSNLKKGSVCSSLAQARKKAKKFYEVNAQYIDFLKNKGINTEGLLCLRFSIVEIVEDGSIVKIEDCNKE